MLLFVLIDVAVAAAAGNGLHVVIWHGTTTVGEGAVVVGGAGGGVVVV